MKNFLIFGVLMMSCLMANDEESYVFEAKGEFAKELKALVEKHAKDENVQINVYENKNTNNVGDSRFLGVGINKNIEYSAKIGEEKYKAQCAECHGVKGEKSASTGSKRLSNMSGKDIFASFNSYLSDGSHGGSARIIMQGISAKTSSTDLGYIIAYLKGEDDFIFNSAREVENSQISTSPTEQGTYIK